MSIRQPRMEREHRHLDQKRQTEGDKEPGLRAQREIEIVVGGQIEGVDTGGLVVDQEKSDDCHQHQK